MISDETIQAALIAKIKTFTDASGTSTVKEAQWQGDIFEYPAIRLDLESNTFYFDEQRKCILQVIEFSIYEFSEEKSSKQVSTIKGKIINDILSDGFTTNNVKFMDIRLMDNVPAIRQDERTWRAQAQFRAYVS